MKKLLASAVAWACLSGSVQAALPSGVSGPWFNPEQSGHGVTVQIVDAERALVFWHVYDRAGAPLTLYVEGEIHGRRIEGQAYAPRGMRFGEFDPTDLELPVWGEVDLEFDDCNTATLQWQANDAAFGSGELALDKLVPLQQDACALPPRNAMKPGLYQGTLRGGGNGQPVYGMVDADGRLWAKQDAPPASWGVGGPTNPGFNGGWQLVASAQAPSADCALPVRAALSIHAWGSGGPPEYRSESCWRTAPPPAGAYFDFGEYTVSFAERSDGVVQLVPLRMRDLARTWTVQTQQQFVSLRGDLRIDAEGRFCLDRLRNYGPDCDFTGRISLPDGDTGVFDYRVDRAAEEQDQFAPALMGRGWLSSGPQGVQLHAVGVGLTLVAF